MVSGNDPLCKSKWRPSDVKAFRERLSLGPRLVNDA